MSLLTEGPETLLVYPAVRRESDRGNAELGPAAEPVRVEGAWVFPAPSTQTGAQTQLVTHEARCAAFPAGPWSKVTWQGRGDLDVIDVLRMPGPESVLHDVVKLRARKPPAVPDG